MYAAYSQGYSPQGQNTGYGQAAYATPQYAAPQQGYAAQQQGYGGYAVQQQQQAGSYGSYQDAPRNRNAQRAGQQQPYGTGGAGISAMPPASGGGNEQQSPLAKKVMVLYVVPGEAVSMQAWQMVADFPEVLVQDARSIQPRPSWMTGVPTVVMVNDKSVHAGPKAFQVLYSYVQNIRAMNGAQSEMVVPTVDPNSGFAVASKENHYRAAADEKRTAAVPVGTSTHTAMTVGQVNFSQQDDPRYYSTGKVDEAELNNYMAMREQKRQVPVQWKPSVLENGEMVTM